MSAQRPRSARSCGCRNVGSPRAPGRRPRALGARAQPGTARAAAPARPREAAAPARPRTARRDPGAVRAVDVCGLYPSRPRSSPDPLTLCRPPLSAGFSLPHGRIRAARGRTPVCSPHRRSSYEEELASGPRWRSELAVRTSPEWNGLQHFVDLVRAPPSGTWDRRRADRFALAEDWLGEPPRQRQPQATSSRATSEGSAPRAHADVASSRCSP